MATKFWQVVYFSFSRDFEQNNINLKSHRPCFIDDQESALLLFRHIPAVEN